MESLWLYDVVRVSNLSTRLNFQPDSLVATKTKQQNKTIHIPMWTYQNNTLGFDVPARMSFDSAEDYDKLAGEDGAHMQHLAARLCYGGFNAKFRAELCNRIEAETGITWPIIGTKKVGDKDEPIYMNEAKYLNLVRNSESAPSEEKLNQWAQEIASGIEPVGPEKSERGKPSKDQLAAAEAYMAKFADGSSSFEVFKEKWEGANGVSFEARFGNGEATVDLLARAVKANQDRKIREAKNTSELD